MLKDILSITGKPGLFKMITQAKNMIIVESLQDGKRYPIHAREKVISLGDIAIFTDSGDVALSEVFEKMKQKEEGKQANIDPKADNDTLRSYLKEIIPDFDEERVYPTDIKKMIKWYNLLIENNLTDFSIDESNDEDDKDAEKNNTSQKDNKAAAKQSSKASKAATKTKVNNTKSVTNRKMGG